MKYNALNLTDKDKTTINVVARTYKFRRLDSEIIYQKEKEERLRDFIDSYRFLFTLIKDDSVTAEIKTKIRTYIKQFEKIYNIAIKINENIDSDTNFGKSITLNNLSKFVVNNDENINLLISDVFPLGRISKIFDPDENQALY